MPEPVFAEPWEAQVFALAVKLSEQGHFTWKEWTEAFASAPEAPYYERWLSALESLVSAKGLAEPLALLERKQAWADAYRHTPHGKPVELKRG